MESWFSNALTNFNLPDQESYGLIKFLTQHAATLPTTKSPSDEHEIFPPSWPADVLIGHNRVLDSNKHGSNAKHITIPHCHKSTIP